MSYDYPQFGHKQATYVFIIMATVLANYATPWNQMRKIKCDLAISKQAFSWLQHSDSQWISFE